MAGEQIRNLRHELRTPINHIVGYAELLLDEPELPAGFRELLTLLGELARESLGAIASIVSDAESVEPDALSSLRAKVEQIEAAGAQARTLAPESATADLARISEAIARLESLVTDLETPGGSATLAAATQVEVDTSAPVVLVVDDDAANR
ncbi:MAG: hypothetical protein KC482_04755, partial [Dehalococcoidia bacterium]|nr:hypothetical protein [Dehalococcoidia bacterium]